MNDGVYWSIENRWWKCSYCTYTSSFTAKHICNTVTQPVKRVPVASLIGGKHELNLRIEIREDGVVEVTSISLRPLQSEQEK